MTEKYDLLKRVSEHFDTQSILAYYLKNTEAGESFEVLKMLVDDKIDQLSED